MNEIQWDDQKAPSGDILWDDPKKKPATTLDRAQAGAAGVNHSVLAGIPGLPVDTALNVWDLIKAGVGAAGGALGVKAGNLPQLTQRGSIPMSSEWIANQVRKTGVGIDANQPDDAVSRLLFAGGQGVGGAMLGGPRPSVGAATKIGAQGGVSALAAQGTQEMGGNESLQVLAALAPGAAPAGYRAATRIAPTKVTPRDEGMQRARDNGFVFPPSQVNQGGAGLINSALEKLGGKIATEQAVSVKNRNKTHDLVRKDFGLPEDMPLTPETMGSVRGEAGKAYAAVHAAGPVVPDAPLIAEANKIFAPYAARSQHFKNSAHNAEIEGLRADFKAIGKAGPIDAKVITDQIAQLRADGFANRSPLKDNQSRAMGKVQIDAATALENLVDRNLAASGNKDLLSAYRDARKIIAKSYTAEAAMNPVTGEIDASKLARALGKGKPLEGGMRAVAEAASISPKSMNARPGAAGISKLDATISTGSILSALATGNPALLLGTLAAPASSAARGLMLSGPYQRHMISPAGDPRLKRWGQKLPEDNYGLLGSLAVAR